MKKYYLLPALMFSLYFSSCQEIRKSPDSSLIDESEDMIELDIDLNKNSLPYDSLMDFVKFVKLETTGNKFNLLMN